jgi:hypothetical protein
MPILFCGYPVVYAKDDVTNITGKVFVAREELKEIFTMSLVAESNGREEVRARRGSEETTGKCDVGDT